MAAATTAAQARQTSPVSLAASVQSSRSIILQIVSRKALLRNAPTQAQTFFVFVLDAVLFVRYIMNISTGNEAG